MADKYIRNVSGTLTEREGLVTSAGAGDAGKIPALDAGGKLDVTLMPAGLAPDSQSVTASEALSAGDFVNLHNSSGLKMRKADATTSGKEANGFVKAAVSNGASGTLYFEGINDALSGLTAGSECFLGTTPGQSTHTAPSGSGNVVQRLGKALSATSMSFEAAQPIVLA